LQILLCLSPRAPSLDKCNSKRTPQCSAQCLSCAPNPNDAGDNIHIFDCSNLREPHSLLCSMCD
jgi:hypothetical protein